MPAAPPSIGFRRLFGSLQITEADGETRPSFKLRDSTRQIDQRKVSENYNKVVIEIYFWNTVVK